MENIELSNIDDKARTPLVDALLGVIEKLLKQVQALQAENRRLKKLPSKPKIRHDSFFGDFG